MSTQIQAKVAELCQQFALSELQIRAIMQKFLTYLESCIKSCDRSNSPNPCLNTHVQSFPTKFGTSKFVSIEVRTTNFQIAFVKMGENMFDLKSRFHLTPKGAPEYDINALFFYIGERLQHFLHELRIENEDLPLGIAIDFPIISESVKIGKFDRWTREVLYNTDIGNDILQIINRNFERVNKLKLRACIVVNSCTALLVAGYWSNDKTRISCIFSSGYNCAYMEKTDEVPSKTLDESEPYVVLNCESGRFGDMRELEFIRNVYDKAVDNGSKFPGKQIHEKMLSGRYVPELVRQLLDDALQRGLLPEIDQQYFFAYPDSITLNHLMDIDADPPGELSSVRILLGDLGMKKDISVDTMINIKYMVNAVWNRSSTLVAANLAVLVNKINERDICIVLEGRLVHKLHSVWDEIVSKTRRLIQQDIRCDIVKCEEASAKGAALLARLHCK